MCSCAESWLNYFLGFLGYQIERKDIDMSLRIPSQDGSSGGVLEQPQAKALWIARQMKARESEFTETETFKCGFIRYIGVHLFAEYSVEHGM